MRSIFLDYYIGSLLLWNGKKDNSSPLSCEPNCGYTGDARPEYIVLDGQQRLTAMYYAYVGPQIPFPRRVSRAVYSVNIDHFMAEEYDKAFEYDWDSKNLQKLFADQEALFSEHIFPCSVMGAGGWELGNWVQDYEKYWVACADAAAETSRPSSTARPNAASRPRPSATTGTCCAARSGRPRGGGSWSGTWPS